MNTTKTFESQDQRVSFHITQFEGMKKELTILIEEPYTKKEDVVLYFNREEALEMVNEMLRVILEMKT